MTYQRPSGPGGDAVATLRETTCEDEREELRREVCALRRQCQLLETRLSLFRAALELAYRAGQRDLRAQLGLAPRQERPRRSRYLSIAPGVVIAAGGIAALVTAAGIGAG